MYRAVQDYHAGQTGKARQAKGSVSGTKKGWRAVWAIGLALALTACSTGAIGGNASPPSPAAAEPAQTAEAETTASPEASGAAFPVTITHMMGEYTLTEKPKVIAALDVKFVDQLIALGELPAGSVTAAGSDTDFPEYLSDRLGGTQVLGTRDEPNLEAIVALNPDLILMTDFQQEAYESVSKIAPTLVFDFYEDWRDTLDTLGELTGKQEEAKTVREAYAQKVAGLKTQFADKLGEETVALIRPRTEGIRVHTPQHRTGAVLYDDLGLNAPDFVSAIDDTSAEISMEVIGDVGADHYFLLSDALFQAQVEELENTVTWSSLDAVKNNRVYPVDTTLWIAYYGPIAMDMIVDQAAEALLGKP